MNTTIRNAKLDDLSTIQKLNLRLFEKEHEEYDASLDLAWTFGLGGTDYFTKRIVDDDGCVLLALVDDLVVGYLCGGLSEVEKYRTVPSVAELENMFVLEDFRCRGIGRLLYDAFIDWCKKKDIGRLRVAASTKNIRALDFYRREGFLEHTTILERDV